MGGSHHGIDSQALDIHTLDGLSLLDSPIHRLDARAKLITTLVFVVVVASHDKYQLAALTPYFLFPVMLLALGQLPLGYIVNKILLVSPFAIFMGMANPFLDNAPHLMVAGVAISGGWISYLAIMERFVLAIGALIILIATTGMTPLCRAAGRLGTPTPFVVQLLLLYRYLFLLVEEGSRMVRARNMRSFGGKGLSYKTLGQVVGHLLLRSLARGGRIHQAMLLRGFDGEIRLTRGVGSLQRADWIFMVGWCGYFLALRFLPASQWLGSLLTGLGGLR
ncbi:MAG: cobalt ECF transporter T component CbiQ [Magnetococcales bacterium]|nr:cobalt ECF transporter T component CbiQ [Magnetococcales bacterium]